jgi:hypothetical protein
MSKDRNYAKELGQIARDVESDLYDTIDEVMKQDVLIREEISQSDRWYNFPYEISVRLEYSDEPAMAHSFIPEGTVFKNGYVVPKGGMIYTDHPRGEELIVGDLDVWGMIDLLEELKHTIKNKELIRDE